MQNGNPTTDKMKVYSKISKKLKQMMPQASQNQVVVLAMMVAGIVMGRKAQLSAMGLNVPHQAKPASLTKRFQRFVKNEHVDRSVLYRSSAFEQLLVKMPQNCFVFRIKRKESLQL